MIKIINSTKSFEFKIKSLFDIEKQLVAVLPKMAKAATDEDLKDVFVTHLEETKMHIERLEQIFEILDMVPQGSASEGIQGIITEADMIINAEAPSAIKDAMLAGVARTVEHFEMVCYMGAIEEAKNLGYDDVADILSDTLDEEEATDKKLTTAFKDSLKIARDMEDEE